MMQDDFSSGPDPALGAELRTILDGADTEAFVARLTRAVIEATTESSWDVLARWAPGGLVAAAAAVVLWFIAGPLGPAVTPAPLASAPVQIEVTPTQPEAVVITVAVMEGR